MRSSETSEYVSVKNSRYSGASVLQTICLPVSIANNTLGSRSVASKVPFYFDVFTKLYLAGSMGMFSVLLNNSDAGVNSPSSTFLISWIVMYGITGILFILHRAKFNSYDLLLLLFISLICFSSAWSTQKYQTATYGICIAANLLFVLTIRKFYTVNELLNSVAGVVIILCVIGLAANYAGYNPTRYIDVHDRLTLLGTEPLRGFFNHKITAGLYSLLAIVICYHMWRGWSRILAIANLVIFMTLTGSSAAIALLALWVVCVAFVDFCVRARLTVGAFYLALIALAGLAVGSSIAFGQEFLLLLDRDPSLTGRTFLWAWGIDVGMQKPFFGWGYAGYLGSEAAQEYARTIASFQTYEVPHFHNSYVQLFVDLGAMGLLLGIAIPLAVISRFYRRALKGRWGISAAAVEMVIILMVAAFFVHVFYKHNDFLAILTMALFSMRVAEEEK